MPRPTMLGTEIDIFVGTLAVACADEISLDISSDMLSTLCAGSGDIKTARPGKKTIKGTLKGLAYVYTTAEEALNVGYFDWLDAILGNTLLTIAFKTKTVGDRILTGTAYASSFKLTASVSDNSKYDASFEFQTFTTNTLVTA